MNQSDDLIKKSKERLITAAGNCTDNIRTNRSRITSKQKWKEKQLYYISSDKLAKFYTPSRLWFLSVV